MREVKYRAWHKHTKIMAEVSGFTGLREPDDYKFKYVVTNKKSDYKNDGYCWQWQDVELLEYTGLKDKNGVEIYEGDVVETVENINTIKSGWRFTVEWDAPKLKLYGVGKYMNNTPIDYMEHADIYFNDDDSYIFEVIGNIYENPELLK